MNGFNGRRGNMPTFNPQGMFSSGDMFAFPQPELTAPRHWSTTGDVDSAGRPLQRITQQSLNQYQTYQPQLEAYRMPNQNQITNYSPPTPTEIPEHANADAKPRPSRFLDDYDESSEATIRPSRRPKPQLQDIYTNMHHHEQSMVYAPSPPGSASLTSTRTLGSPMMTGQQNAYGSAQFNGIFSGGFSYGSIAPEPTTPIDDMSLSLAPPPQVNHTQNGLLPMSRESTQQPYSKRSHRRQESAASQLSTASIADLDVEATKIETGITCEDINKYIEGPDPNTGKWKCTYEGCNHCFGRKENIRSHVQTHLGDRQYKCPTCEKRFVRQHDLKRHAKIHTGVRPYACPCGQEFARQDALTRHRQRDMCVGAADGIVKTPAKRGRPKKNRPEIEERKVKSARTRLKNLSVSSVSSAFTAYSMNSTSPAFVSNDAQVEDLNMVETLMHELNSSSTAPMPISHSSPPLPVTPLGSSAFVSPRDVMSPQQENITLPEMGHALEHTPGLSPSNSSPDSFLTSQHDPAFSSEDDYLETMDATMIGAMPGPYAQMEHNFTDQFSHDDPTMANMMYADDEANPFCAAL